MLFFLPILFINVWAVVFALIKAMGFSSNTGYFLSVLIGVVSTLTLGLSFMFEIEFVYERFIRTVTNEYFYYMGVMTLLGIVIINKGFHS
jgi:hypothetical protein